MRDAIGPEMELLIDCHGRFSPASAIAIAQELEPYRLYWFEEPCDPENVAALAKIGRSIRTRLATGERCYTKHHLQALLRDCEVGVLQPDVIHVGGILEAKKIAAIADASYTPVSYHNPFGPVATAAALQLDACTTNFIMQELFCEYSEPWRFDLLEHAPRPEGGHYAIPTLPGLGVGEFQAEVAKAHPFDPQRLPADVERRLAQALLVRARRAESFRADQLGLKWHFNTALPVGLICRLEVNGSSRNPSRPHGAAFTMQETLFFLTFLLGQLATSVLHSRRMFLGVGPPLQTFLELVVVCSGSTPVAAMSADARSSWQRNPSNLPD